MGSRNKVFLVILAVLLMITGYSLIDLNNRFLDSTKQSTVLEKELEELTEINHNLSSDISDMNKIITDLDLEKKNLMSQITDFEEKIEEYNATADELISKLEEVESKQSSTQSNEEQLNSHSEYYMLLDNKIMSIGMKEDEVLELFGEPHSLETGYTETSINSYNNRPTKKYIYDGFHIELMYISERAEDGYWIRMIVSELGEIETIRGVKVGDTEDNFLTRYPFTKVTFISKENENEKMYVMENFILRKSMTVQVKDGIISRVSVNFIFD